MSRYLDSYVVPDVSLTSKRASSSLFRTHQRCKHRIICRHANKKGRLARQVLACATTDQTVTTSGEAPSSSKDTLFKKLGGGPAVRAAVDLFYDKMISDPRVNFFFEGIDMNQQRAHQASFLTYALGGSKSYEGNGDMTAAHSRLARDMGMRMEHFDIVLEHLGSALCDLQVPEEDIGEAAAVVETLRPAFQVAIDEAAAK